MEILQILEPGASNSLTNVRFELSVAKISKIKQNIDPKLVDKSEAKKFVSGEIKKAQKAFDILVAGCEGKISLESRLKRVVNLSLLKR